MSRGFEVVKDRFRKYPNSDILLPERSTKYSAGYDFYTLIDVEVPSNGNGIITFTDVKAYMKKDEVLKIYIRSSLALKKGLYLLNSVGIIDSDYYNNQKNDGNIGMGIGNSNPFPVMIKAGERIAQGIFEKYYIADNEEINDVIRGGGIGSTNK